MTIEEAMKCSAAAIKEKGVSQTPSLDIQVLLSHVLGVSRATLFTHPEFCLSTEQETRFLHFVSQRLSGLPVAYSTGIQEFWGLPFAVTRDVLIPKADTELLIEKTLDYIEKNLKTNVYPSHTSLHILDACTGSGCIAISLLHEIHTRKLPCTCFVTALDISDKALAVAQKNADCLLSCDIRCQLTFVQADVRIDLKSQYQIEDSSLDIIVSNPPYVPSQIVPILLQDGRSEPCVALDGGEDGLAIIQKLIPNVKPLLKKGGILFLETGEYNAKETRNLLSRHGFTDIETYNDLAQQERVTQGKAPLELL